MDQGPLVVEQREAGARLASQFARYMPLQAAFWLKEAECEQWYLYLVSDEIDESNFDQAYAEVVRLLRATPQPGLGLSDVKVLGADDPLAKSLMEFQQRYPGPTNNRVRNRMMGGVYVEDSYLYAVPIAVSQ